MKTPSTSTPSSPAPLNLHGLTRGELRALVESWGFSPVHAARLWNYLYYETVDSLDDAALPGIPAKLRARLQAETALALPPAARETQSADGFTRKFLLTLADGKKIETVLMRFTGRVTACISSQAGCAMGCVFCATGRMGLARNLTAAEIVAQTLHVQRILKAQGQGTKGTEGTQRTKGAHATRGAHEAQEPQGSRAERLRNVVLMGMGEPLLNYDAVMRAAEIMRDGNGLALGARRITLSTVGVVPGILRMAREASPICLAVSLHAATQTERAALVPAAAKRWPLDELMDACRRYAETLNRRVFFEWTLIAGQNDTEAHARALGQLLTGAGLRGHAQVNLIPLNPVTGYDGAPPGRDDAAKKFQAVLATRDLPSTVRQRRGLDIAAGCGQLAATALPAPK